MTAPATTTTTPPVLHYGFAVSCPNERCDASQALVHENGSHTRRTARAVMFYPVCHCRFLYVGELTILDPPGRPVGDGYMSNPVRHRSKAGAR